MKETEEKKKIGRPLKHGEKCVTITVYLPKSVADKIRERGGARYLTEMVEKDS